MIFHSGQTMPDKERGRLFSIQMDGSDSVPFIIKKDRLLIGRADTCEIRIYVLGVSAEHCIITFNEEGRGFVEPVNKCGLTFLNGELIKRQVSLEHNDVITIVKRSFRFFYPSSSKFYVSSPHKEASEENMVQEHLDFDPEDASTKKSKDISDRRVTFGPRLSPEEFDKNMPPASPLRKGSLPDGKCKTKTPCSHSDRLKSHFKRNLFRNSPVSKNTSETVYPESSVVLENIDHKNSEIIYDPIYRSYAEKSQSRPLFSDIVKKSVIGPPKNARFKKNPSPKRMSKKALKHKDRKKAFYKSPKRPIHPRMIAVGSTGHANSPETIFIYKKRRLTPNSVKRLASSAKTRKSLRLLSDNAGTISDECHSESSGLNIENLPTSSQSGDLNETNMTDKDPNRNFPAVPHEDKNTTPLSETCNESSTVKLKSRSRWGTPGRRKSNEILANSSNEGNALSRKSMSDTSGKKKNFDTLTRRSSEGDALPRRRMCDTASRKMSIDTFVVRRQNRDNAPSRKSRDYDNIVGEKRKKDYTPAEDGNQDDGPVSKRSRVDTPIRNRNLCNTPTEIRNQDNISAKKGNEDERENRINEKQSSTSSVAAIADNVAHVDEDNIDKSLKDIHNAVLALSSHSSLPPGFSSEACSLDMCMNTVKKLALTISMVNAFHMYNRIIDDVSSFPLCFPSTSFDSSKGHMKHTEKSGTYQNEDNVDLARMAWFQDIMRNFFSSTISNDYDGGRRSIRSHEISPDISSTSMYGRRSKKSKYVSKGKISVQAIDSGSKILGEKSGYSHYDTAVWINDAGEMQKANNVNECRSCYECGTVIRSNFCEGSKKTSMLHQEVNSEMSQDEYSHFYHPSSGVENSYRYESSASENVNTQKHRKSRRSSSSSTNSHLETSNIHESSVSENVNTQKHRKSRRSSTSSTNLHLETSNIHESSVSENVNKQKDRKSRRSSASSTNSHLETSNIHESSVSEDVHTQKSRMSRKSSVANTNMDENAVKALQDSSKEHLQKRNSLRCKTSQILSQDEYSHFYHPSSDAENSYSHESSASENVNTQKHRKSRRGSSSGTNSHLENSNIHESLASENVNTPKHRKPRRSSASSTNSHLETANIHKSSVFEDVHTQKSRMSRKSSVSNTNMDDEAVTAVQDSSKEHLQKRNSLRCRTSQILSQDEYSHFYHPSSDVENSYSYELSVSENVNAQKHTKSRRGSSSSTNSHLETSNIHESPASENVNTQKHKKSRKSSTSGTNSHLETSNIHESSVSKDVHTQKSRMSRKSSVSNTNMDDKAVQDSSEEHSQKRNSLRCETSQILSRTKKPLKVYKIGQKGRYGLPAYSKILRSKKFTSVQKENKISPIQKFTITTSKKLKAQKMEKKHRINVLRKVNYNAISLQNQTMEKNKKVKQVGKNLESKSYVIEEVPKSNAVTPDAKGQTSIGTSLNTLIMKRKTVTKKRGKYSLSKRNRNSIKTLKKNQLIREVESGNNVIEEVPKSNAATPDAESQTSIGTSLNTSVMKRKTVKRGRKYSLSKRNRNSIKALKKNQLIREVESQSDVIEEVPISNAVTPDAESQTSIGTSLNTLVMKRKTVKRGRKYSLSKRNRNSIKALKKNQLIREVESQSDVIEEVPISNAVTPDAESQTSIGTSLNTLVMKRKTVKRGRKYSLSKRNRNSVKASKKNQLIREVESGSDIIVEVPKSNAVTPDKSQTSIGTSLNALVMKRKTVIKKGKKHSLSKRNRNSIKARGVESRNRRRNLPEKYAMIDISNDEDIESKITIEMNNDSLAEILQEGIQIVPEFLESQNSKTQVKRGTKRRKAENSSKDDLQEIEKREIENADKKRSTKISKAAKRSLTLEENLNVSKNSISEMSPSQTKRRLRKRAAPGQEATSKERKKDENADKKRSTKISKVAKRSLTLGENLNVSKNSVSEMSPLQTKRGLRKRVATRQEATSKEENKQKRGGKKKTEKNLSDVIMESEPLEDLLPNEDPTTQSDNRNKKTPKKDENKQKRGGKKKTEKNLSDIIMESEPLEDLLPNEDPNTQIDNRNKKTPKKEENNKKKRGGKRKAEKDLSDVIEKSNPVEDLLPNEDMTTQIDRNKKKTPKKAENNKQKRGGKKKTEKDLSDVTKKSDLLEDLLPNEDPTTPIDNRNKKKTPKKEENNKQKRGTKRQTEKDLSDVVKNGPLGDLLPNEDPSTQIDNRNKKKTPKKENNKQKRGGKRKTEKNVSGVIKESDPLEDLLPNEDATTPIDNRNKKKTPKKGRAKKVATDKEMKVSPVQRVTRSLRTRK